MIDAPYDSNGRPFPTVDIDRDGVNLAELHAHVVNRMSRVELRANGDSCVLISKNELDSLERALEILSDSDNVRAVREQIAIAAQLAVPGPADPAASVARITSFDR
jgi:PHD/YefM family antitoxin component YafN of YafNO toxin-antitoxin module